MSHRIASTLFVLLLAFGQTTLLSQDVRERLPERTIPDERQELQTVALKSQALEGAIDPETYLVGPGDAFNIELEGLRQYNSVVTVSPEGKLIIPTLGVYDVQGKSVTEVRRLVAEKARSKFVGGQIKINLVGVRDIRVHVTGQVAQPGTYQAKSVYRISDVITLAGGLNSWANARSIELRRENQPTQVIDYYAFMTEESFHKMCWSMEVMSSMCHLFTVQKIQCTLRGVYRIQGCMPSMRGRQPSAFCFASTLCSKIQI